MQLIPGICSQCGAVLSVYEKENMMICPYCNTPFVVQNAVQKFNVTYNMINNISAANVIIEGAVNSEFTIIGGVLKKNNGSSLCVNIPDNVIKIDSGVFEDSMITEVEMPDTVKEIGTSAFRNCKYLSKIVFSNQLEKIGLCAFQGCQRLTSIHLPESLESAGAEAFEGCELLDEVYMSAKLLQHSCLAFERRRDCGDGDVEIGCGCPKLRKIYVDGHLLEKDNQLYLKLIGTMNQIEMEKEIRRKKWKEQNRCQYCGGNLVGFFTLKCVNCGKTKDY